MESADLSEPVRPYSELGRVGSLLEVATSGLTRLQITNERLYDGFGQSHRTDDIVRLETRPSWMSVVLILLAAVLAGLGVWIVSYVADDAGTFPLQLGFAVMVLVAAVLACVSGAMQTRVALRLHARQGDPETIAHGSPRRIERLRTAIESAMARRQADRGAKVT